MKGRSTLPRHLRSGEPRRGLRGSTGQRALCTVALAEAASHTHVTMTRVLSYAADVSWKLLPSPRSLSRLQTVHSLRVTGPEARGRDAHPLNVHALGEPLQLREVLLVDHLLPRARPPPVFLPTWDPVGDA